MKLSDFDHPIVLLFVIWMGVIALTAVFAWIFSMLGWTGPLGLLKGGACACGTGSHSGGY